MHVQYNSGTKKLKKRYNVQLLSKAMDLRFSRIFPKKIDIQTCTTSDLVCWKGAGGGYSNDL